MEYLAVTDTRGHIISMDLSPIAIQPVIYSLDSIFWIRRSLKRKLNLIADPVIPTIIKMTIGMIFGMLAISAFNIVDTYFVGKLGSTELAAISFTFPVIMILNSLSWGLGLGVSSTVSRALGTGNRHKVIRLASDGIALSLLIVLVVMAVGIVTIRPLFTLLGAKGKILELIQIYRACPRTRL